MDLSLGSEMSELMSLNMPLSLSELQFLLTVHKNCWCSGRLLEGKQAPDPHQGIRT